MADAQASEACPSNGVEVQLLSSTPIIYGRVVERYTRMLEVHMVARLCRFNSCPAHHGLVAQLVRALHLH